MASFFLSGFAERPTMEPSTTQPGSTRTTHPGSSLTLDLLKTKLSLTEDQAIRLSPILDSFNDQLNNLKLDRKNNSKDPEAFRAKIEIIEKDFKNKATEILTSGQIEALEKLLAVEFKKPSKSVVNEFQDRELKRNNGFNNWP